MSNLHDKDKRYVNVYDGILKLVYESLEYIKSHHYDKKSNSTYDLNHFYNTQLLSIHTHRDAGISTTALRLFKAFENSLLIVPHNTVIEDLVSRKLSTDNNIVSIEQIAFFDGLPKNIKDKHFDIVIVDSARTIRTDIGTNNILTYMYEDNLHSVFKDALIVEL